MVIQAWEGTLRQEAGALLVLAPRHPERFGEVEAAVAEFTYIRASQKDVPAERRGRLEVVLLDTIGDLAAVYGVANAAFVGGSLVQRGGHNPLEPAQFGVPVVMGPSYENFRDVVGNMVDAYAIRIVQDRDELGTVLFELLTDREGAKAMGERGLRVFAGQQGATGRVVATLVGLVQQ
jgi:3-deoxy-D-manno-octulosonic-acid transferase